MPIWHVNVCSVGLFVKVAVTVLGGKMVTLSRKYSITELRSKNKLCWFSKQEIVDMERPSTLKTVFHQNYSIAVIISCHCTKLETKTLCCLEAGHELVT